MRGKISTVCATGLCLIVFVVFLPLMNNVGIADAQAPLPRLENPTTTLGCGLPVHGWWNQDFYTDNPSLSKPYTWTLTADCALPKIADNSAWLHYANSGSDVADATFIIDGAGYTITGPDDDTTFIFAENDAKVVLRNLTIKGADYDYGCSQYDPADYPNWPASWGRWWCNSLIATSDSELDVSDVTIATSTGGPPFEVYNGSTATFKNLTVKDNVFKSTLSAYAGVVTVRHASTEVTINGAVICKNQARHIVSVSEGEATLQGALQVLGNGANTYIYANENLDEDDDVTRNTDFSYKSSSATISDSSSKSYCPGYAAPRDYDDDDDDDNNHNWANMKKREPIATCQKLVETNPDILVFATYGLTSGVECQQVAGAGIGIQWVLDLGVIDAVDVWAYVSQGVEVCFQHYGKMLFLDADTAPRTVRAIERTYQNGWTCSHIVGHGTLVLIAPPGEADSPLSRAVSLEGCRVATTDMLSLRVGPGAAYERIDIIPYETRLTARARADNWFQVEYAGKTGWVSGNWVMTSGDCL